MPPAQPKPTSSPDRESTRRPSLLLGLALLVALLVVDGLAVWSIFAARQSARDTARQDLEMQTRVHARSLEALLANLRADLLFLAQSPPLLRHAADDDLDDPMARRWSRLDAESTLLLFLQANDAVDRVVLHPAGGGDRLVAGRRGGAPLILPGDAPPPEGERRLHGAWPVGTDGGRLEAWVEPASLLAVVAPGLETRLRLASGDALTADDDALRVAVRVTEGAFAEPAEPATADSAAVEGSVRWLVREEVGSEVLRSFEELSRRYRTTLLVNVGVVALTLVLAAVALRQVSRAARLEAENLQQVRIRELERQLMHSERLAGVGRLAAGMAHEINNPLEGMSNYLRLLEDDLSAGDVESAASTAPKLREGLERAAGVVRQVLAFSDPGKAPKRSVDLRDVVAETARFVAGNPAFQDLEIESRLPDEPLRVHGNVTALGQLVLNLLLNACEIQLESGTGGRVGVRLEATGDTARLEVADEGPGFDDDALDHVFEPFYSQRDSSGLGLSVCHGIVGDHGGTITAQNREEGGARVVVELPIADSGPLPEGRG